MIGVPTVKKFIFTVRFGRSPKDHYFFPNEGDILTEAW